MDITFSSDKIKSNKVINGETVNYSLFYLMSVAIFLIVKQVMMLGFGIAGGISMAVSFGIASVVLYLFERKWVFTHKVNSPLIIQVLALIFRSLVNVGFYFIAHYYTTVVLSLEPFVQYLITAFILYYFNYGFDRLVIFNCTNKPSAVRNGRIYRTFHRNRFVVLSGILALICFLFIFLIRSLFPFDEMTVMRMDLYHQYGPLFVELYDRVINHSGLLYSWESGGGSSFIGNYFNYLSSPFSVIILLFKRMDIDYAITTMVLVKGVVSACTFSYYLKKSLGSHSYSASAFGALYAFCGYFLAYYWNIMWIDGMIFLPLVLLGIENIIKYGRPQLYVISLTVLLFSSYYMGYMTCIFSVLYFLAYFVISDIPGYIDPSMRGKGKPIVKRIYNVSFINRGITFAIASLMCGVLCACTLIPVFSLLQGSSATSGTFPTTFDSYFDLLDLLKSHISALETTIRSSGDDVLPNVYCGILTVLLVPLYFMNKDIKLKEKAVYLLLLLVLIFSFDNNMMDYIWHAMHFPNDLPFRYSYMYSFILLVIAYRGLKNIKSLRYQDIVAVGILWLVILLLFQKEPTNKMREYSIYISIAFTIIWTGFILLVREKKLSKLVLGVAIVAITFSEVIVSDSNSFVFDVSHSGYTSNYKSYTECARYIKKHDKGFYRSELTYLDTRMDPCYYGYDGMSVFSSMAYEDYSQNQYSLGMMGNRINSYTYNTQTPVYNMMYGIKYLTRTGGSIDLSDKYYKYVHSSKDGLNTIYEYKYTLPIAFLTPNNIKDWINDEGNPFDVQEDLIDKASGVSNAFIPAKYNGTECYECSCDTVTENGTYFVTKTEPGTSTGNIDITVTCVRDGELYLYISSYDIKNINYYWNDNEETHYQSIDEPYIMNLGNHRKGDKITVSLDTGSMDSDDGSFDIYAYNIDDDVLASAYDMLSACAMDVTSHTDTCIEGKINAGYDGYLYSSIPYDEGWSVYIDGEKQKTFDIGDSQLATTIKKGEHTIRYKYTPKGLRIGLIISGAGYVMLALCLLLRNKIRKSRSLNEGGNEIC